MHFGTLVNHGMLNRALSPDHMILRFQVASLIAIIDYSSTAIEKDTVLSIAGRYLIPGLMLDHRRAYVVDLLVIRINRGVLRLSCSTELCNRYGLDLYTMFSKVVL